MKISSDSCLKYVNLCLVCGEPAVFSNTPITGPAICSKCKSAILKVRKEMEDFND
jgi:hypothetical protein